MFVDLGGVLRKGRAGLLPRTGRPSALLAIARIPGAEEKLLAALRELRR